MNLVREPNLEDTDAIYEQLIAMLEGESEAMAMRKCARLILLLMNHIGDKAIIEEAIARAGLSLENAQ